MLEKIKKTDDEWKQQLTPEQYAITRKKATEQPFSGEYVHNKGKGIYECVACGQALFSSDTKFESGTGWPSFWDVVHKGNVNVKNDFSFGMSRVEVTCSRCDAHLGHLFEDGPREQTGLRYCINSGALNFRENK